METSIREIRILSGLQAGASLTLPFGQYIIGTADDCDVILNDRQMAPYHARVFLDESTVRVESDEGVIFTLDNQEALEGEVSLGVLFRAGNTWFVIENSEVLWPDMQSIFAEMKPLSRVSGLEEAEEERMPVEIFPYDTENEEPSLVEEGVYPLHATEENQTVLVAEPQHFPLWSIGFFRQHAIKTLVAIFVLGIAILCVFLVLSPKEKSKEDPAKLAILASMKQIEQILQKMHLKQRVTVAENKQGKFVLSGYLATDQDMADLVDALAKLHLKLDLRLFTEVSIVSAANHILRTSQLPIKAMSLGMGRIQLIGAAPNYESIDTLSQKMVNTIDGLRGIESDVLIGDQLLSKLRQMIVDRGLAGKVALTMNNGEAVINGALDIREMAQWEQLMAEFVSIYGNILPIRASFPPTSTMLPFRVLSAFSGEIPFIVTNNGQKVTLGGRIQGYTLVNVTDQEIVFDGPRKVQIQR